MCMYVYTFTFTSHVKECDFPAMIDPLGDRLRLPWSGVFNGSNMSFRHLVRLLGHQPNVDDFYQPEKSGWWFGTCFIFSIYWE